MSKFAKIVSKFINLEQKHRSANKLPLGLTILGFGQRVCVGFMLVKGLVFNLGVGGQRGIVGFSIYVCELCVCMCVCACHSVCVFMCLSSICVYVWVHVSVRMYVSVCLPVCLSVVCLSVCLCVWLYVPVCVCLSVGMSAHMFMCLCTSCLSLCMWSGPVCVFGFPPGAKRKLG